MASSKKAPVGFIENKVERREAFTRQRKGLLSMVEELARLCKVTVAVVCADLDGGATTVMESEPGVLDRYRALPDERRAEHTHLRQNKNAKIARVKLEERRGMLELVDADMSRMKLEELRRMLELVDAALAAAGEGF